MGEMMQVRADKDLVRDYVAHDSDAAFRALVARHVDLVYASALRQQRLNTTSRALAEAQSLKVGLQRRLAEAAATRDATRQALREQRRTLNERRAAAARAERDLAKLSPDACWANPPASAPDWDDHSPYVWLDKAILPVLLPSLFTERGELRDEVAGVLALDATATKTLNDTLSRLLAEHRALEAAHAERLAEPLPGIPLEGSQVTLQVQSFPGESERLKQQFKASLGETLGPQRARLLFDNTVLWLNSQFPPPDEEAKTITVVRHSDGSYDIATRAGNSRSASGGFTELSGHVPDHLLPLFSAAFEQAVEGH